MSGVTPCVHSSEYAEPSAAKNRHASFSTSSVANAGAAVVFT